VLSRRTLRGMLTPDRQGKINALVLCSRWRTEKKGKGVRKTVGVERGGAEEGGEGGTPEKGSGPKVRGVNLCMRQQV